MVSAGNGHRWRWSTPASAATRRAAVVVEADGRFYVGPDNGLFEIVLRRAGNARALGNRLAARIAVGELSRARPVRPGSGGFALGGAPAAMLRPTEISRVADWPDDLPEIVYVDHYGNAMTGLRAAAVPAAARLGAGGRMLTRARTFSDAAPGSAFWYENSNGLAEIAVNAGRADAALGLAVGSPVAILA